MLFKDPKEHHIQYLDLVRIKLKIHNKYKFFIARIIDVNLLAEKPSYAVELFTGDYFRWNSKATIYDNQIINHFGNVDINQIEEKYPEYVL